MYLCLFIRVPCSLDGLSTTNTTCATSSDQPNLLARRAVARDGRRVSDVLMATTTVGVLDGVLCDTTDFWPAVALCAESVEDNTGF